MLYSKPSVENLENVKTKSLEEVFRMMDGGNDGEEGILKMEMEKKMEHEGRKNPVTRHCIELCICRNFRNST